MEKENLKLDIKVNTEEIEEAIDKAEELEDMLPRIVVKHNENVYITINNFKEGKDV